MWSEVFRKEPIALCVEMIARRKGRWFSRQPSSSTPTELHKTAISVPANHLTHPQGFPWYIRRSPPARGHLVEKTGITPYG